MTINATPLRIALAVKEHQKAEIEIVDCRGDGLMSVRVHGITVGFARSAEAALKLSAIDKHLSPKALRRLREIR